MLSEAEFPHFHDREEDVDIPDDLIAADGSQLLCNNTRDDATPSINDERDTHNCSDLNELTTNHCSFDPRAFRIEVTICDLKLIEHLT